MLKPHGNQWACEVCRHTGRWHTLAPFRCEGPALKRWEQRATRRAHATATDGQAVSARPHILFQSGLVFWCNRCGCYAYTRAVLMARPCTGPPRDWRGGGRAQTLTALRRNRHPKDGGYLPTGVPVPKTSSEDRPPPLPPSPGRMPPEVLLPAPPTPPGIESIEHAALQGITEPPPVGPPATPASGAPVSRVEAVRQRVIQRQLASAALLDPAVAAQHIGLDAPATPSQQTLLPSLTAIRTRLLARQATAAALDTAPPSER